jgi:AraC-like DNA-binding protein
MDKKVLEIGFNFFRYHFDTASIDDEFMLFDNLNKIIDFQEIQNIPVKLKINASIICTQGYAKVKIGIKTVLLEKDYLLVLLAKQILQVIEISNDFKAIFMIVDSQFMPIPHHFKDAALLREIIPEHHCFPIPLGQKNEILTITNLIKFRIRENSTYRKQIINSYCNTMLYNTFEIFLQNDMWDVKDNKSRKENLFEMFILDVTTYHQKEHDVAFYAGKLNISTKYLSLLVKEISGKSAAEWIKQALLVDAMTFLKSGNLSIQQISDKLNFCSQSHFGIFFKRYTGFSPKDYQKQ